MFCAKIGNCILFIWMRIINHLDCSFNLTTKTYMSVEIYLPIRNERTMSDHLISQVNRRKFKFAAGTSNSLINSV